MRWFTLAISIELFALVSADIVSFPLLELLGRRDAHPSPAAYSLSTSKRSRKFYEGGYWNFSSSPDPTHGTVQFTTKSEALSLGLIGYTDTGAAFARASTEDLDPGQFRRSIRFQSYEAFDEALIVFDVVKMPVGCATWPALWTVNEATWPYNGEIDVLEGIGYSSLGQNVDTMTVHMGADSPNQAANGSYTGLIGDMNCNTTFGNGNSGCVFHDLNKRGPSWGEDFNDAGGGIWALQFGGGHGIKTWFWGRGYEPKELCLGTTKSSPKTLNPLLWGPPTANFQSPVIDVNLTQQNIVLDLTIGGDWAGNVPMDGPCTSMNFTDALQVGSNYLDAEFILNAIDVYESSDDEEDR